jgi:hypothetical protein
MALQLALTILHDLPIKGVRSQSHTGEAWRVSAQPGCALEDHNRYWQAPTRLAPGEAHEPSVGEGRRLTG